MTDDPRNQQTNDAPLKDITRRDFAVLVVGAGLAATVQSSAAADLEVIETDVEIKTPDGTCDAAFIRPKSGSHPGVLVWPDAFGLRPALRHRATYRR
jgi:carboxymethylenebutenolidase